MVSAYQQFVKDHYHKLPSNMSSKEKMSAIAAMWRKHSGSSQKMHSKKKVEGKGFLSDALGAVGLGLPTDLMKKHNMVEGKGFLSDALGAVGLGLPVEKKQKKGGKRQKKQKKVQGEGFLSDALGAVGLGLPVEQKKHKKVKGGVISGAGGPVFTGAGGIIKGADGVIRPYRKYNDTNNIVPGAITLSSPVFGNQIESRQASHSVEGAGIFDSFMKGLTMPFRVAAAIPLPGLQQIGQAGSAVANALGV